MFNYLQSDRMYNDISQIFHRNGDIHLSRLYIAKNEMITLIVICFIRMII